MNKRPQRRRDPLVLYLRVQTAELIAREADVRAGREESVHRMRVATRRLRSCLRTFRTAFATEPTRHLRTELAWLGEHLGAERDAEVIAARVARDLKELPSENVLGPVKASLRSRGSDGIVAAHDSLIGALASQRYRALLEVLAEFAMKPPFRTRRRRARWLRRRVVHLMWHTRHLVDRAHSLKGAERDAALHEVRKSAKHVRYAAETLIPIDGRRARRVAQRFESFQKILGEHQDAVVTRRIFRDEGARAGARVGQNGFTYGVLFAEEDTRAREAERAFKVAWKRSRRGQLSY